MGAETWTSPQCYVVGGGSHERVGTKEKVLTPDLLLSVKDAKMWLNECPMTKAIEPGCVTT